MSDDTIQGQTLDRALDAARRRGLDPQRFFRQAGVQPILATWADNRVSSRLFADFLHWAAIEGDDPTFGLHVGADFERGDLGALGYFLLNAPTIGEGLAASERWFAYLQDGGFFRARRMGPDLELLYDGGDLPEGARRQDAECGLAIIAGQLRKSIGVRPREVRSRDHANAAEEAIRSHFGCRVIYGCPDYGLVYDADILGKPIRGADPVLFQILGEYVALKVGALPPRNDIVAEVKWRLGRGLADGTARLTAVAKDLKVSPRTLQRRLAERGESFDALLEQVRLQAFSDLRSTSGMKKCAISAELGFSNPSAFHRWSRRHVTAHHKSEEH
ncbi:AraC family transcriptional regulator [Phenylobacterium montanum]|uniref:AraC family transcriptional regulator ligand-binding domain-containing protein n=1 Tax=Phenylobacterium montanum TaxID=2823693 RepID=A0A975G2D8_9CAUL|nr:AraC family transcriptional regulator [Caulobacter sp. S6]QUD89620.1 AraC family transcriptional regulator ligand-binding domain-containing protein [Caulobacter sp. S6]